MQLSSSYGNMAVRFQPIVDTATSCVFAYQCSRDTSNSRGNGSAYRDHTRQRAYSTSCEGPKLRKGGPVFVDAQETALQSYMHESMPRLRDIVYQFRLWSAVGQFPDLGKARDAHHRIYLSLALQVENADTDTFAAVETLRPDYLKLSGTLVSEIEHPACGDAVRRLTALAEKRGLVIIAEDVQTLETVENLWLLGVRNMQGDYFSQSGNVLEKHRAEINVGYSFD